MSRRGALVHQFVHHIPEHLVDGVLYVSVDFATVLHRCCCGCGNEVVAPLSPSDWSMTFDGESISLCPSIGNRKFRLPVALLHPAQRGPLAALLRGDRASTAFASLATDHSKRFQGAMAIARTPRGAPLPRPPCRLSECGVDPCCLYNARHRRWPIAPPQLVCH